jgi:hypothetical protein
VLSGTCNQVSPNNCIIPESISGGFRSRFLLYLGRTWAPPAQLSAFPLCAGRLRRAAEGAFPAKSVGIRRVLPRLIEHAQWSESGPQEWSDVVFFFLVNATWLSAFFHCVQAGFPAGQQRSSSLHVIGTKRFSAAS